MTRAPSFRWTYATLWLIRIWFAFRGTGYIHPDEYMQNGEITAGNVLGLHTFTTWEWGSEFPVRSIFPVFASTGLPLLGLKLLFGPEQLALSHPSLVFYVQRLTFVCLSGILDVSIFNLISQPTRRRLALLLFASSYVTCTFQVRPFSNSIESISLSLCLVLLTRVVNKRLHLKRLDEKNQARLTRSLKRDLHLLAALAVFGTFTRPTFVPFALPIAYQVLRISYQVAGSPARTIGLLLPPCCTAALAASFFIATDTYYFRGDFFQPVVTPYNFLKYNMSAGNLAEHGLHPNWLHVVVNLPMLLGPLLGGLIWSSLQPCLRPSRRHTEKVRFETETDIIIRQTLIQVTVLSLSVLSAQPHQEPRFLTPLILPIIVLASTAESTFAGFFFWITWTIFNVVLALVFGFLHQGGVVLSLFALHSTLRNGTGAHIVYWKTYMPPRHLLGVSQKDVTSGLVSITDLAGVPRAALITALSAPSLKLMYLATPASMFLTLPHHISSCMGLETSVFPHLDLDHIHESVQTGGYDGLRLGVYAVERRCIVDALTTQGQDVTP